MHKMRWFIAWGVLFILKISEFIHAPFRSFWLIVFPTHCHKLILLTFIYWSINWYVVYLEDKGPIEREKKSRQNYWRHCAISVHTSFDHVLWCTVLLFRCFRMKGKACSLCFGIHRTSVEMCEICAENWNKCLYTMRTTHKRKKRYDCLEKVIKIHKTEWKWRFCSRKLIIKKRGFYINKIKLQNIAVLYLAQIWKFLPLLHRVSTFPPLVCSCVLLNWQKTWKNPRKKIASINVEKIIACYAG